MFKKMALIIKYTGVELATELATFFPAKHALG
jgi:hypothetical protein